MSEFFKILISIPDLDQIVLYACVILFIWGGTNKFGRKLEFNDDFTSLDAMKSLRGFAAIGVLLHHISQEELFQNMKVLSPFVNAGAYFVAIFFFCSGYGLIKSLDTKKDYLKGFIRNRIVKAIVLLLCKRSGLRHPYGGNGRQAPERALDIQLSGPYHDE